MFLNGVAVNLLPSMVGVFFFGGVNSASNTEQYFQILTSIRLRMIYLFSQVIPEHLVTRWMVCRPAHQLCGRK